MTSEEEEEDGKKSREDSQESYMTLTHTHVYQSVQKKIVLFSISHLVERNKGRTCCLIRNWENVRDNWCKTPRSVEYRLIVDLQQRASLRIHTILINNTHCIAEAKLPSISFFEIFFFLLKLTHAPGFMLSHVFFFVGAEWKK